MEKKEQCGVNTDQEWGIMIKTFLLILAQKNEQRLKKDREKLKQSEEKKKKKTEKSNMSFEEKESYLLSYYENRIAEFGVNDLQAQKCCIEIGDFYAEIGQYDKAFVWLEKAEKQGEEQIYAEAVRKIGILCLLGRNYKKAFEKFTHAIKYQQEYGSTEGEEYCILMGLMGDFYFALKDIEKSLCYYEIWHKLFHKETVKNQLYLERVQRMGNIAERLKKREQSSIYYKEAVEYIRQHKGECLDLAKGLLKLGEILLKIDKDNPQGEQNINEAIKLFGNEKGKESKTYGKLMSKLGVLYISLGKIEQGISFLEQSYQIQCDYEQTKILSKKGYETLIKYLKESKDNTKYQLIKKGKPLY